MPTDDDERPVTAPPSDFTSPKGGLYGGSFDSSGITDPNVRALLMDSRWISKPGDAPTTKITYAFPEVVTDYTDVAGGYPDKERTDLFLPATAEQKAGALVAMRLVESYTKITFELADSPSGADATFRFAGYDFGGSRAAFPTNNGPYNPIDSRIAGDNWLGGNGKPTSMDFYGTDHLNTIMHEMGHALGLKHGHDTSYNGGLSADTNDNEFSVMTYASYFGADTEGATEAHNGSAPQSYMMYDIAALQAYYGANFDKRGTTATYTWDENTGQQFINGTPAPNTGVTATEKIFSTVWTQGALTTYDLSNFAEDQVDDLRPGKWLLFARDKLAALNSQIAAPSPSPFMAQGNVYNALLYMGDMSSMISNLTTGSGNDTITGNDIDNELNGGAGNDYIVGGAGNDLLIGADGSDFLDGGIGDDTLLGGAGNDQLRGGAGTNVLSGGAGADLIEMTTGKDTLRDSWADMQADRVSGFKAGSSLDMLGSLIGRSNLEVTYNDDREAATLTFGGNTFTLGGVFNKDGDFVAAARGIGADAHTTLTFANFLPILQEGVRVAASWINGVVSEGFLQGDGSVTFTLDLQSAVSAFANSFGYYEVAANGTLGNVHILFANTLNVAVGTTRFDLSPAADTQLGFFLIQDGAHRLGLLPDDLSFRAPGSTDPASLDAGVPPTLFSNSLGSFDGATIFHSFSTLNPGDSVQVLSGTNTGGLAMFMGFEDLLSGTGDNDYQDVVISLLTNANDLLSV